MSAYDMMDDICYYFKGKCDSCVFAGQCDTFSHETIICAYNTLFVKEKRKRSNYNYYEDLIIA